MKKIALMLSGSLLAATFAFPVLADDYGRGGGMGMKQDCMMDKHGMHGDCPMMGTHNMTGMIDKIDHAKGTLILKHGAADMLLHFPPAAIKDLKNGDTITVHLGFSKTEPGKM
jgi:hypothetical protein